jgi:hypothetical protein
LENGNGWQTIYQSASKVLVSLRKNSTMLGMLFVETI